MKHGGLSVVPGIEGCFKQALIFRVAYAVEQGKTQGLYPHKLCLS